APRVAPQRPAAGAARDVAAHAQRATRPDRDAGAAGDGRRRARGDEPPDEAAARARAEERAPRARPEPLSGGTVARVVERGPELEQALTVERPQLLPDLALVDRELILDHLARERLVPRAAANPVLACAHDVDALLRPRRRGPAAGKLVHQARHFRSNLFRRPVLDRLGHSASVRLRSDAASRHSARHTFLGRLRSARARARLGRCSRRPPGTGGPSTLPTPRASR